MFGLIIHQTFLLSIFISIFCFLLIFSTPHTILINCFHDYRQLYWVILFYILPITCICSHVPPRYNSRGHVSSHNYSTKRLSVPPTRNENSVWPGHPSRVYGFGWYELYHLSFWSINSRWVSMSDEVCLSTRRNRESRCGVVVAGNIFAWVVTRRTRQMYVVGNCKVILSKLRATSLTCLIFVYFEAFLYSWAIF